MKSFIIIILYLFVVLFDFLPMIRKKENKKKKEVWVYAVIMVLSFCPLFLESCGVGIPPLYKPIEDVIHIFVQ